MTRAAELQGHPGLGSRPGAPAVPPKTRAPGGGLGTPAPRPRPVGGRGARSAGGPGALWAPRTRGHFPHEPEGPQGS